MCLRMYTSFLLCHSLQVDVFFAFDSLQSSFCSATISFGLAKLSRKSRNWIKQFFSPSRFLWLFFLLNKVYGIEWCLSDRRRKKRANIDSTLSLVSPEKKELSRSDFCPIYLIYWHCSSLLHFLRGTEANEHKKERSSKNCWKETWNWRWDDGQEEIAIIPQNEPKQNKRLQIKFIYSVFVFGAFKVRDWGKWSGQEGKIGFETAEMSFDGFAKVEVVGWCCGRTEWEKWWTEGCWWIFD